MVHGARADPIGARIDSGLPRPLAKTISPEAAGKALVAGIERRAARTIRPRRWALYSWLRGLVNPVVDETMRSRDDVVEALAAAESLGREER